jgi:hypothetical protein
MAVSAFRQQSDALWNKPLGKVYVKAKQQLCHEL